MLGTADAYTTNNSLYLTCVNPSGGTGTASWVSNYDYVRDGGMEGLVLSGVTGLPFANSYFLRQGNLATLHIQAGSGTSNSTSFGLTLDSTFVPAYKQYFSVSNIGWLNNGAAVTDRISVSTNTDGTMTFYLNESSTGWTSSGTKGNGDFTITYKIK
jgi:hypothetical protein